MLQVAAYCRVSTDKEDQANSFEAQQRYFREYIQRQPDWELQGIYADEGFSGTSTNKRVEFNKMLHAAELGQIDLIVIKGGQPFHPQHSRRAANHPRAAAAGRRRAVSQ